MRPQIVANHSGDHAGPGASVPLLVSGRPPICPRSASDNQDRTREPWKFASILSEENSLAKLEARPMQTVAQEGIFSTMMGNFDGPCSFSSLPRTRHTGLPSVELYRSHPRPGARAADVQSHLGRWYARGRPAHHAAPLPAPRTCRSRRGL